MTVTDSEARVARVARLQEVRFEVSGYDRTAGIHPAGHPEGHRPTASTDLQAAFPGCHPKPGVDQVGVEREQVIRPDWPGLQIRVGAHRVDQLDGSGDKGGVEVDFGSHASGMITGSGQARRLRPQEAALPGGGYRWIQGVEGCQLIPQPVAGSRPDELQPIIAHATNVTET